MKRLVIVGCLLLSVRPSSALARESIDLSGPWQTIRSDRLSPPPETGWKTIDLPGTVYGYRYEASWFRCDVDVPANWTGRRVFLRFGGVRWNSQVFVNDQPVGGCLNGFDAFALDVTTALRPGARNQIRVGCRDFTGAFDPAAKPVDFAQKGDVRDLPRDRVIAPIGGVVTQYGIWDRCRLEASAPVSADDVTIVTSVRRQALDVTVAVANPTAAAVSATVRAEVRERRDGTVVLALPAASVDAAARSQAPARLTAAWPTAHLWSHFDPYLYDLRVVVEAGGAADEQTIRFGFREIERRGGDLYLNGARIHMLASSWWPASPPDTDDQVRAKLGALLKANTRAFRTHTQPWPENWYTIADELGVLMIPEGAVWNDDETYRLDDDRFWSNYRAHLLAMVRKLKNHPSIVIYSLENEFAGTRINDNTPARKAKLAALADVVRGADPTRLVTYESDLDPGFKADVIGLHYPNEWPHEYQWPNCADWMDRAIPTSGGGGGFWDGKPFLWEKQKPLYIGEYLWIPSDNPDQSTIFLGDEAYRDYHWARTTAKAISWDMQIKAYRRNGVSGHSPWTVVEQGPLDESNACWVTHRDAYRPLAAFTREWDRRFYTDQPVSRRVDVYNDTMASAELTLVCGFTGGPAQRRALGVLPPGGQTLATVQLPPPAAGPGELRIALEAGGRAVFEDRQAVTGYARQPLAPPDGVGLYDPLGTARSLALPKLASLNGPLPAVLVIAPEAVAPTAGASGSATVIGGERGAGPRLADYVRQGGRLLVLSQTALPSGLFGLQINSRDATMAFGVWPAHPVLQGVAADDLKFWRGDHFVTRGELTRPQKGGALPLVVTGSGAGVNGCGLLEVRQGRGRALFCTLRLLDKLATEPAAGIILRNAWRYLAQTEATGGRTALWCADPAKLAALKATGLRATRLTDLAGSLDGYQVLIVCDPPSLAPWAAALRRFVDRGGQLVLSQVTPQAAGDLSALGLTGVKLSPFGGSVSRAERLTGPLAPALLREDLYWLAPQTAVLSWTPRSRLGNQAMAIASPTVDAKAGTTYRCTDWELSGQIVRKEPTHCLMATTGSVRGRIKVPRAGEWVLAVTGWSTPCDGQFATIAVIVDGQPVGEVSLAGRQSDTYALRAELPAGEPMVELRFINDASNAKEDRNAYLAAVALVPLAEKSSAQALTSPAALLQQPVGRGLVVLDEIRWHDAPGNEVKARRYLASLLTAVGAEYVTGGDVAVVEGARMRIQPGLQWSGPRDDHMAMVQACWAEADLDVRTAGDYDLVLTLRGQPAKDGWPHAVLLLDGQPIGEVTATSRGWQEYRLKAKLPAGRHVLRVNYDNDLWSPETGEDRNLYLQRIEISAAGAGE